MYHNAWKSESKLDVWRWRWLDGELSLEHGELLKEWKSESGMEIYRISGPGLAETTKNLVYNAARYPVRSLQIY